MFSLLMADNCFHALAMEIFSLRFDQPLDE